MRLLHSADWHLGRTLYDVDLLGDQRRLVTAFVDLVRQTRPDAVLLAGDLFDRAIPPVEAVRLMDEVLCEIALGLGVPVIAISGNHDGGTRLGFGARAMRAQRLHMFGGPSATGQSVTLGDRHGTVEIWPLPFADPGEVRTAFPKGDDDAPTPSLDHETALALLCRRCAPCATGGRRVAIAHAYVDGGTESRSERPLTSVGGSGRVPASLFDGFDYVALGHLHRPQTVGGRTQLYYSGSLMRYSESELEHEKSVALVTLGPPGTAPEIEAIALSAPGARTLVKWVRPFAELLTAPPCPDFLIAHWTDEGYPHEGHARLRERHPHLVEARPAPRMVAGAPARQRDRIAGLTPQELFARFWQETQGRDLSDEEASVVAAAIETAMAGPS